MAEARVKVSEGGRIVIPARFRETPGLKVGDEVALRLEDHGLRLWGLTESIRESQAIVRGYVSKERSLSDELIRDREREADRE